MARWRSPLSEGIEEEMQVLGEDDEFRFLTRELKATAGHSGSDD